MGRVLLVGRLAVRNVRRHLVEAALLVLAITAATATLTVGRALTGVTDSPYERTRDSTAGPDVVASVAPTAISSTDVAPADTAGLEALADAAGVVGHSGPFPVTLAELELNGVTAPTWAQGRETAPASVDQPRLTEGSWVRDGGVVVEAAFADVLGVGVGDELVLDDRSFEVVGVAATAASSYAYECFGMPCIFQFGGQVDFPPPASVRSNRPPADAGLVWITEADARRLAPSDTALSYVMNLELADPAQASTFVDAHPPTGWGSPYLASWMDIRDVYNEFVRGAQLAFTAFGGVLTLLAIASVAVLVGGRVADQSRRVGLLKAVGATPGLVAVVLVTEYLLLAVLAAGAGLGLGWLAAPLVSDPGAGLLGGAGAPPLTMSTVAMVTVVALGVALIASVASAVNAARTSTAHALADAARRPRRTRWMITLSTRLPVPLLFGLRVMARRPRRVVLGVVSIVVTVSGIVAVLGARAATAADWTGASSLDPIAHRVNRALLVITVVLVSLAAINAIVITWTAAIDSRRSMALARALGATPRQVSAGLSAAQVLPALVGAILGIPAGLTLWAALSGGDEATPTSPQLLAVVAGTGLVVAILTSIPARLGACRPVAQVLRAEHT
jgi:putative ABC transport system permease protein